MWHRTKDLWTHNRKAFITFLIMVAFMGFFGVRAVGEFIYWSDPAKRDQTLAGWMTPRYVTRSYRVPPDVVRVAFDLQMDERMPRMSLETLSAQTGLSLQELEDRLTASVEAFRATRPVPDR